jgi:hypothetical protein
MELKRHELETFDHSTTDFHDRRKKVARAVFSYKDPSGVEYRKAFTAPARTPETEFWNIAPKTITQ